MLRGLVEQVRKRAPVDGEQVALLFNSILVKHTCLMIVVPGLNCTALINYPAHAVARSSACCSTVCTARSCLSGG